MLFHEIAQRTANTVVAGTILFDGRRFVVHILRFDGQRKHSFLAVNAYELGFDLLVHGNDAARIVHTVTRQFGDTDVAFYTVSQFERHAFGIHFNHFTGDQVAASVRGQEA